MSLTNGDAIAQTSNPVSSTRTPLSEFLHRPVNWFLLFVPITVGLEHVHGLPAPVLFFSAALAIVPIAALIVSATEQLATRTGDAVGGLLNATFGNAAELIIALFALSKGLTGVVKASITGSIIGNVLLVLGLSFLNGGLKHQKQQFNRTAASISATALTLAAIALIIPTIFHIAAAQVPVAQGGWTPLQERNLSLAIAIVLFLKYAATMVFTLVTHKSLFGGHGSHEGGEADHGGEGPWTIKKSVSVLVIATVFVAMVSEFLVGAVEGARETLGLTEVFVGVIIVAIIGNAAEHSSAILLAVRNKMDITIGIAVGSSLQIALLIAPILVFASYLFGTPMDLEFTLPEVIAVAAAILIVEQISGDGESNWVEGVQLLSVYAVLAILFYFLPDVHHPGTGAAATPHP